MNTLLARIRGALASNRSRLRLYSMEYCYYCRRVQREASRLGIKLTIVDVFADREGRERLRAATGRTRVPVLEIPTAEGGERYLPESDDIIFYLRGIAEQTSHSVGARSQELPEPRSGPFGAPGKQSREEDAAE